MAEGQPEANAIWNLNNGLEHLLASWNIRDYHLFVTGGNNFRYAVYPEYKANRTSVRPEHLQACKAHLMSAYGATQSEGCEADDLIGIEAYKRLALGEPYVVMSIDKDLNMIEGLHYSPEIKKGGVIVREAQRYHVSPNDAIRFFYYQLLVGDTTDNVKGVKGIGARKAERALRDISEEAALYNVARSLYDSTEEMEMNARVLWIWRKENDDVTERWKTFQELM